MGGKQTKAARGGPESPRGKDAKGSKKDRSRSESSSARSRESESESEGHGDQKSGDKGGKSGGSKSPRNESSSAVAIGEKKGGGKGKAAKSGDSGGDSDELSISPATRWAQEHLHSSSSSDDSASSDSDSDAVSGGSDDSEKERRKSSRHGQRNLSAAGPSSQAEAEADSIPLDLKPGDIEIGEFLGDGVYSEVFKGTVYGTPVAVKKFKNQGFDPNVLKEVRKEVRIMRSIRHPNLLLFLGACTEPGELMIVTELMGCSFHELVGQGVSTFDKIVMAKEAAKGLSWLHSLTPVIIHRDLKPENILVSENRNTVKVADFGLSLVRDNSSAMVEEMKKIRGSPAFMSPEALLAKELTPATDVYSFGMILWELFTEGSPYDDLRIESFEQLIDEICEKNTRERIPEDFSPALSGIVAKSWLPKPEDRPTFLEVIEALDTALLEHAIPDPNGRRMWERCFRHQQGSGTTVEVPFAKFQSALEYHVDVGISSKLWTALQAMMHVSLAGDGKPSPVHILRFGNLLRWFGPMEAPNANEPEKSFLARMQRLFTYRWFHGDISTEMAETRLSESKPGTFLVRFSSNPGQWALSKVVQVEGDGEETQTLHIRVHYEAGEFSVSLGNEVYKYDSLTDLVKAPVLELGSPCPGSKYYAQFRVKQRHLGYVN
jgi:tRNA A-37 threonylcarbamoyl transferase component Bud32